MDLANAPNGGYLLFAFPYQLSVFHFFHFHFRVLRPVFPLSSRLGWMIAGSLFWLLEELDMLSAPIKIDLCPDVSLF